MSQPNHNLLTNKVEQPVVNALIVRRDRLTELLDSSWEHRLTLLTAPSGYGKTTLLVEWLSGGGRNHPRAAWVTFDEFDNDPLRFWTTITSALKKACHRLQLHPQSLIDLEQDPGGLTLLNPLLNEIAAIPYHTVLVLDDCHAITNNTIQDQLGYFVEHLPQNLNLIVSGRVKPQIPLSRLRAQRALLEITERDLAFSLPEAQSFFVNVMNLAMDKELITALWNSTEGWIAGLQLAALSYLPSAPSRLPPRHDGLHDNQLILDYFVEEVLNHQSAEVIEFLLKSSVLEELSAPQCDAVLGRQDSERLLHQIDAARLFMVRLDSYGSYRYHTLFAAALQTRLRQANPEGAAEIHLKACDWFVENRQPNRAIAHALAAGSLDKAAEIIETTATEAILNNDLMSISRWMSIFPSQDAIFTRYPRLGIYCALVNFFLRRLDLVHPILLKIGQVFAAGVRPLTEADRVVQWQLSALRAVVEVSYGNRAQGIPDLQTALTDHPPEDHFFYGLMSHTLAVGYREIGELEKAASTFHDTYRHTSEYTPAYAVRSLSALAQMRRRQARLREAHQIYQDAADRHVELNIEPIHTGVALGGLLETTLEQNDLPKAEYWAARALDNRQRVLADPSPWARIGLAAIDFSLVKYYAALGNLEEAIRYLTDLKIHKPYDLEATSQPPYQLIEAQVLVGLAMQEQRMDGSLLDDAQIHLNQKATLTYIEMLSQARIHRAHKHYPQAHTVLEKAESRLRETQEREYLIETLIVKALVCEEMQLEDEGLQALDEALSLAEPDGYVHIFLREGPAMKRLLKRRLAAIHDERLQHYAQQLVSAFGTKPESLAGFAAEPAPKAATLTHAAPQLSQRELEVLHMLNTSLSYKEIAVALTISVNTVKIHVRNIYRKLGADSRRMALERARELPLLG